jgi:hypothetical protein
MLAQITLVAALLLLPRSLEQLACPDSSSGHAVPTFTGEVNAPTAQQAEDAAPGIVDAYLAGACPDSCPSSCPLPSALSCDARFQIDSGGIRYSEAVLQSNGTWTVTVRGTGAGTYSLFCDCPLGDPGEY